jgi:predicted nucleic acid-binding protein
MFLLDTNVVSETRKPRPHGAVISWLSAAQQTELHLPAVVVGELQTGVERVRPHDATKAAEFEAWLDAILNAYAVVAMDGATFRIWARLMTGQQEHLSEDAMIAATALQHGATVVTRNVRDFRGFNVPTLNPFA